MMRALFNFIVKRPKKILLVAAMISVFFVIVLLGSTVQTNIHQYIDQKYIGPLDYINENFGERDLISVTVEAMNEQNILSPALLREQDRFFREVQYNWPVEVDGLTTVLNKHIAVEKQPDGTPFTLQNVYDEGVITDLIMFLYHADPYEFERLARKALSNEETVDMLQELEVYRHMVGVIPSNLGFNLPSVTSMRATITTEEVMSREDRRKIFTEIRELSMDYSEDIRFRFYSYELIEEDIDTRLLTNSPFVIGFMIVLLAFVLFITFRSLFFTLVPILILCVAISWAFGLGAMLGIKSFAFGHIIAIPLLIGQCIDNLIHFNERFREEYGKHKKKEAIKMVFITAGKAAALTTILNMVAFSVDIFTTNLVPVKEYALLIVLGLGIALVAAYIVGAALMLSVEVKVAKESSKSAVKGSNGARNLFDFIYKYKVLVLVISFMSLGGMLYSISQIDLAFRTKSFMPENFITYDAYKFEQDNFKLYMPHYVLLKGNIATQTALDVVTKIEETLDGIPEAEHIHGSVNTESINYLLAKLNKDTFPETLEELYPMIRESDLLINPISLLTTMDVTPKIIQEENGEFPATLIKFWPAETDSFAIKRIADSIAEATEEFAPEITAQPTGTFLAFSKTMDDILWSATSASLITVSIIIIFLWAVYRRLKTSLISVIPVVFGAAFGLGMLPILGIELNALNGTIAVLAMGLGIDYSIQMMSRYLEELAKHETPVKAMRETFAHMVVPLGQCVILTTAGLFVLIGLLPITGKFGVAAAVSLITGYLGAILIMPIFAINVVKECPKSLGDKFKS